MKKKLNIALIAPIEETTPPKKYGGTELVVYNLCEGLVERGHRVTLMASGGSKTRARLIPLTKKPLRNNVFGQDEKTREIVKLQKIAESIEMLRKEKFDIVHNHIGWRLLLFSNLIGHKMVTTLHGPLNIGYQNYVYNAFRNSPYVSISNNQRIPNSKLNFIATVYNGIDVKKFSYNPSPKNYVAFLGRMSPEKGPKEAILAAKKAKIPLIMAAKIDVVDKKYFTKEIRPLIDGKRVKFIGEVGPKEKNNLLKNALALFALIQWREPFGLFVIEAMACGTPVIATPKGALPELIINNATGFFADNPNDAAKKLLAISHISRSRCREHVEKNFSLETMAENYEKAYYKVLGM